MRFYFNLRIHDLLLRNGVCIAYDSTRCSRYNSIFLSLDFSSLVEISPKYRSLRTMHTLGTSKNEGNGNGGKSNGNGNEGSRGQRGQW